jgi:hypothetical protein
MEKCKTCKAFKVNVLNKEIGECRRYAPKIENRWPVVFPYDWCLEYVSEKWNPTVYIGGCTRDIGRCTYTRGGGLKPGGIKLTKEGEALGNGNV